MDRSAAYAARHIAKNLVAAGVADEMLVQVSYAIGVARPVNIYVNTYGRSHVSLSDGEIAQKIDALFDLRPKAIEDRLKLRNPIYEETALTATWTPAADRDQGVPQPLYAYQDPRSGTLHVGEVGLCSSNQRSIRTIR